MTTITTAQHQQIDQLVSEARNHMDHVFGDSLRISRVKYLLDSVGDILNSQGTLESRVAEMEAIQSNPPNYYNLASEFLSRNFKSMANLRETELLADILEQLHNYSKKGM